jgi:hypothetical protein
MMMTLYNSIHILFFIMELYPFSISLSSERFYYIQKGFFFVLYDFDFIFVVQDKDIQSIKLI